MKKHLFILILALCGLSLSAQTDIPYVSVDLKQITPYNAILKFHSNKDCHHYYVYKDRGNEVILWATVFGMIPEDVVSSFGNRIDTVEEDWTSHWTDLDPEHNCQVYVVPCDADDHHYSCEATRFKTFFDGDQGRSTIQISSNFITDTSAYILCVPNEETAGYYNGIIPSDWFNKLGLDSVCRLMQTHEMLYETDRWGHLFLNRGTRYAVVAFGKNGNGEFGDTTVHWFTTLGKKQIVEQDTSPVIFYSSGGFTGFIPEEQWPQYVVRASVADGSRILQEVGLGEGNIILATLPVSDYFVDVVRKSDGGEVSELMLSIRKEDVTKEYFKENDNFEWTRLRQDYTYALGNVDGTAVTPFIFTKLYYVNGCFIAKTHSGNKLYDVLLTPKGKYIIGTERGYDKIIYDSFSDNLYVLKSGKVGVCDMHGREIVKAVYDDIIDMETCYKALKDGKEILLDKFGKIIN